MIKENAPPGILFSKDSFYDLGPYIGHGNDVFSYFYLL